MEYQVPTEYLNQIEAATQRGIKKGWDAADAEWKRKALAVVAHHCLTHQEFTMNDIRDQIEAECGAPKDKRVNGGLMTTASKTFGWVGSVGQIPSVVGHRVPIQIWRSNIYRKPELLQRLDSPQQALFT